MGRYNDSGVIEGVPCYWCGKVKGIDRSLYFDKKYFCTRSHELKWAAHLKRSGALRPKDVGRRPKRIKPVAVEAPKRQGAGWLDWIFGKKKKNPNIPKAYRR